MARRRNKVIQTANELVRLGSTRDARKFLEDVLALESLPLSTRQDAAKALLPYQHARLHAIYTSTSQVEAFEDWLDKLTGPGKQMIEHELKLLGAVDIDDEPAGTA